jgi:surface polysaccharide O-acyltransferase-like enzyme
MPLKSDALFWKKKEFISFLLSILVFFIHSHFAQDIASDNFISLVNQKVSYFFSDSITRYAIPMFFMMSGISFYKEYSNKKYLAKMKSRLLTLVIPYLLWNTIWMIWEIFTSYSILANFSSGEPYPLTLISILKGIFFYGCNVPFWFIFDLIIFSFAAPIVFLIIKNKYVGMISVICLSVVSLFGIHLPTSIFYYPTATVFYLMGAIIGYHFYDFVSKKSSKPMQIASLVFFVVYILAKNIAPQRIHINNYLTQILVYTLAAFSLWNISDMFIERIKHRAIYRRSFAVYAMHLPVAIVILKIFEFCTPQSQWLEIPKFIIMIISTLAIINLVCAFLEKFLPKIYAILMGNRISKNSK